jgi:hypothetical protein
VASQIEKLFHLKGVFGTTKMLQKGLMEQGQPTLLGHLRESDGANPIGKEWR